MKQIEWYTLMILVMLGLAEEAKAQHVAVSAPTHVAAGENFRKFIKKRRQNTCF
jgi:hypothetical protein